MARDLEPLFAPRSVAIVGASDDPAKWGNWLGRGALRGEHRRSVYTANRNGATENRKRRRDNERPASDAGPSCA